MLNYIPFSNRWNVVSFIKWAGGIGLSEQGTRVTLCRGLPEVAGFCGYCSSMEWIQAVSRHAWFPFYEAGMSNHCNLWVTLFEVLQLFPWPYIISEPLQKKTSRLYSKIVLDTGFKQGMEVSLGFVGIIHNVNKPTVHSVCESHPPPRPPRSPPQLQHSHVPHPGRRAPTSSVLLPLPWGGPPGGTLISNYYFPSEGCVRVCVRACVCVCASLP